MPREVRKKKKKLYYYIIHDMHATKPLLNLFVHIQPLKGLSQKKKNRTEQNLKSFLRVFQMKIQRVSGLMYSGIPGKI